MPDDRFLSTWQGMAALRYGGELGWFGTLYFDTFRGKQVAELGSRWHDARRSTCSVT